jgi:hypothetical protein
MQSSGRYLHNPGGFIQPEHHHCVTTTARQPLLHSSMVCPKIATTAPVQTRSRLMMAESDRHTSLALRIDDRIVERFKSL